MTETRERSEHWRRVDDHDEDEDVETESPEGEPMSIPLKIWNVPIRFGSDDAATFVHRAQIAATATEAVDIVRTLVDRMRSSNDIHVFAATQISTETYFALTESVAMDAVVRMVALDVEQLLRDI